MRLQGGMTALSETQLLARNLGKKPPMAARYQAYHSRNRQQPDDHNPFHSAVVLIWIPACQCLDPVVPEDREDPQNSREQCDGHLQLYAHLRSSQPDYLPTSLLQVAALSAGRLPLASPPVGIQSRAGRTELSIR